MAEFVLTDATVKIGSSGTPATLSDHVRSVTITYSAEIHDKTAMGSSARKRIAGLKDGSVAVEINADVGSTVYDKELHRLVGNSSNRIVVKSKSSAADATNPRYLGPVILGEYMPITNAVGDLAVNSVTFQCNGLLVRSETS